MRILELPPLTAQLKPKLTGRGRYHPPESLEMSVQYRNVLFASVDVDDARELAQIYHIKAMPTFQMFKQAQKVTLFSRIKRAICCYRSGSLSEPIFELCGTDAKKLEEKIRELINYLNLPLGTQGRSWRLNEAISYKQETEHRKAFVPRRLTGSCSVSSLLHPSPCLTFATILE
ncbi:uncharacterized protein [Tursiops truncatus]|uniref:uncharacterized protein isoform X1 n=1 Tax=Tursiops truncatus TaxID=9739 RepID=UPI003CCF6057